MLRNQSWIIDGRIAVIGLEEDSAKRFKLPGPDLEAALRNVPAAMPKVLLYHRPAGFAEAVRQGIDLQLSGHTHAGQIPPMDFLVWLIYKYPCGVVPLGAIPYLHQLRNRHLGAAHAFPVALGNRQIDIGALNGCCRTQFFDFNNKKEEK